MIVGDDGAGLLVAFADHVEEWLTAYGIEIDPVYCDVIIRRLRERAGLEATLAGRPFDQVAAERAASHQEDAA